MSVLYEFRLLSYDMHMRTSNRLFLKWRWEDSAIFTGPVDVQYYYIRRSQRNLFATLKNNWLGARYYVQCPAKTWIYLTLYVCTEWIFDSQTFMYNITILKKLSKEFEIDDIILLKQRFYRFQTFFKDSLCLE